MTPYQRQYITRRIYLYGEPPPSGWRKACSGSGGRDNMEGTMKVLEYISMGLASVSLLAGQPALGAFFGVIAVYVLLYRIGNLAGKKPE